MTMTVSCNGDYNYTTVTTAAICNNSECNKLWYLTNMPWHTPWQWFAIVITILNHHICQRTWDVEQGHNGLQHLCVLQHICALANPMHWGQIWYIKHHHTNLCYNFNELNVSSTQLCWTTQNFCEPLWHVAHRSNSNITNIVHWNISAIYTLQCRYVWASQPFTHYKHTAFQRLNHLNITEIVHLSVSAI